jgi:hypothetical protein
MSDLGDESQLELEPVDPEPARTENADDKAARIASELEELEKALSANNLERLRTRVAWLLNNYPETRDSDALLAVRYWQEFDADKLEGNDYVPLANVIKLTRWPAMERERRRIQYEYRLFEASYEVQRRRGKLSEDQAQRAREEKPRFPLYQVFADETGKGQDYLVVGSIWCLTPQSNVRLARALQDWKDDSGFKDELHFTEMKKQQLELYLAAADVIAANSEEVAYKAIGIARQGIRSDDVFEHLHYALVVHGVEHEDRTRRAPLPRGVYFTKDADNVEGSGKDDLVIDRLTDRLKQAANARYEKQLYIDRVVCRDSHQTPMLQIADLFAGSINRLVNFPGQEGYKTDFAKHFLGRIGVKPEPRYSDEEDSRGMLLWLYPEA